MEYLPVSTSFVADPFKKGTMLGKFQKIIVLVLMIEGWVNWMVRA